MTTTATCLLGLIAWVIALTLGLLTARFGAMFGGHPVNTFTQDGSELAPIGNRVTRAHGNALEWLAIPVGLLLYAITTEQTAVTDGLAMLFLATRVGQSIVHIISTSTPMVLIRATLFTVQTVISIIWLVKLFG